MNSEKWTLIRGARQLLTLHRNAGARRGRDLAELGAIIDGSVLLRDGIVDAVGPTRRIENLTGAKHAEEIDAAGRVVMPAFVDPHAVLSPVPASGQEPSRVVNAVPASRLEAQADRLLRIVARHGTGTVGSLSGYGAGLTGELKILRAVHARHRKPIDIVSVLQLTGEQDTGVDAELLAVAARRKLAKIVAIRSGVGGFEPDAALAVMTQAQSLGFGVRIELTADHDIHVAGRAIEREAMSIAFAGRYRIPETEMFSGAHTVAILLPLLIADGSDGATRDLIDHGAVVALGSGLNPVTGSTANMQTVVQTGCERCGLSIEEAISAATVNAAWALGVGNHAGSLEHGKHGDLILLNASDYRDIPLYTGTNLVHTMVKRGIVLFEEDFTGWPRPSE
jgi:imidazolonepropionase